MQINNPLKMNDWEIDKFLTVVLVIQLVMWSVVGLAAIGIEIPIIRQLIGFIYLTFVPGIIILRILKLHKLGNIETLLYTVGLSMATLMLTGLFMNTVYPLFGISKPISFTYLIITISTIVLLLCVLSYVRDKRFSDPCFIDVKDMLSSSVLFLCIIPFLAILGTYLVNFYNCNILLLFLIVVIAVIVLLIAFDKFIPTNLYPFAVFVIAISLLYHSSLISMYIWGWDIHTEYYFCSLVKMNMVWDPTIWSGCNAMLSLVMVAPIYSIILDMDIIWVFKIIYPLLFSLVPIGLYRVFQKQTDNKIAFLSCFFFVSIFVFYGEMIQLARQQIAELFLVLLILLMIDENMDNIKRSILFIVFGISLVVSHYGLSYIYMLFLISAFLLLVLAENFKMRELKVRKISSTFVLLFIIFSLAWYIHVSSSSAFISMVHIGEHIAGSISTEILKPEATQGLEILMRDATSPLHGVFKYLVMLSQFFIAIGILTLILAPDFVKMKFVDEYIAFALVALGICLCCIVIPHFASSLNTSRLFQITLFFLAPFCIFGGITVFKLLSRFVRVLWTDQRMKSSLKVLSVFLAIFVLFNTGWIFEIVNDDPISISLNSTFDYPRFSEREVLGAEWLYSVWSEGTIYTDNYRKPLFSRSRRAEIFPRYTNLSYDFSSLNMYLGERNIAEGGVLVSTKVPMTYRDLGYIVYGRNKIYANGGAEVYYQKKKY